MDHLLRGDLHETTRQLKEFFILIAGMPDVLHANVYSTERTIVWSSRPELVGKRFVDNHELDEALAGEVVFEIGVAGEYDKKKAEHAVFESVDTRFVEYYIPIWDDDEHKVVAVAEIYKTPHKLFEAIDQGQRIVWSGAVVGGVVLFLAIFWIARRADRVIRG
jgi:two-component system sensor histidine kinase HydH